MFREDTKMVQRTSQQSSANRLIGYEKKSCPQLGRANTRPIDRLLTQLLGIVIDDNALVDGQLRNSSLNNRNPNDSNPHGSGLGSLMSPNNNRNTIQSDRFTFDNADSRNNSPILLQHQRQSASPSLSGNHSSSTSSMVKIIDIQRRAHKSPPVAPQDPNGSDVIGTQASSLLDFYAGQPHLADDELQSLSSSDRQAAKRAANVSPSKAQHAQQVLRDQTQRHQQDFTVSDLSQDRQVHPPAYVDNIVQIGSGETLQLPPSTSSLLGQNPSSSSAATANKLQHSNQKQPSGETLSTSFESDYDLLVYLGETETEDIVDTERSLDYQDQTWRQSICGGASLAPTIDDSLSELLGSNFGNAPVNRLTSDFNDFDLLNSPIDPSAPERSISATLLREQPQTSPKAAVALSPHQRPLRANQAFAAATNETRAADSSMLTPTSKSGLLPHSFGGGGGGGGSVAGQSGDTEQVNEAAELDRLLQEMSRTLDLDSLARYDNSPGRRVGQTAESQPVAASAARRAPQRRTQPKAAPTPMTTTLPARSAAAAAAAAQSSPTIGPKSASQWQVSRAHEPLQQQQQQQQSARDRQQATSYEGMLEEYDGASRMLEQMISDGQLDTISRTSSGSARTRYRPLVGQQAAAADGASERAAPPPPTTNSVGESGGGHERSSAEMSATSETMAAAAAARPVRVAAGARKASTCSSSVNTETATTTTTTSVVAASAHTSATLPTGVPPAVGRTPKSVRGAAKPWQRRVSNSASESVHTSPSVVELSGAGSGACEKKGFKFAAPPVRGSSQLSKVVADSNATRQRGSDSELSATGSTTTTTEPPPLPEVDYIVATAEPHSLTSTNDDDDDDNGAIGGRVIKLKPSTIDSLSSDSEGKPLTSKRLVERVDRMKRKTMRSMRSMRERVNNFMDNSRPPAQHTQATGFQIAPKGSQVASLQSKQSDLRLGANQSKPSQVDKDGCDAVSQSHDAQPEHGRRRSPEQRGPGERLSRSDRFRRRRAGADEGAEDEQRKSFGRQLKDRLSRSKSRLGKFLRVPSNFSLRKRAQSTPDEKRAAAAGKPSQASADTEPRPAAQVESVRLFEPSDIARNTASSEKGGTGSERAKLARTLETQVLPELPAPPAPARKSARKARAPTRRATSSLSSLSSSDALTAGELSGLETSPTTGFRGGEKRVKRVRRKKEIRTKPSETNTNKKEVRRSSSFSQSIRRRFGDTFKGKAATAAADKNASPDDAELITRRSRTNRSYEDLKSSERKGSPGMAARTSSADAVSRRRKQQVREYFGQRPIGGATEEGQAHSDDDAQQQDGCEARRRPNGRSNSLQDVREAGPDSRGERALQLSPDAGANQRRALPADTNTFRPSSALAQADSARCLVEPSEEPTQRLDSESATSRRAAESGIVTPVAPNLPEILTPTQESKSLTTSPNLEAERPKSGSRLARAKSAAASILAQNKHLVFRAKPRPHEHTATPARPPRRARAQRHADDDNEEDTEPEQRSKSVAGSTQPVASASGPTTTPFGAQRATLSQSAGRGGPGGPPTRGGGATLASSKGRLRTLAQQLQNSATDFLHGRNGSAVSSSTMSGELDGARRQQNAARQTQIVKPATVTTDWVEWKPVIVRHKVVTGSGPALAQPKRARPHQENSEAPGRTDVRERVATTVGREPRTGDTEQSKSSRIVQPVTTTTRYLSLMHNNRSTDEPTDTTWQSSSPSDADQANADLPEDSVHVTTGGEAASAVVSKTGLPAEIAQKSSSQIESNPQLEDRIRPAHDSDTAHDDGRDAPEAARSSSLNFKFRSNIPTPAQVRHLIEAPLVVEARADELKEEAEPEQTSAPERPKGASGAVAEAKKKDEKLHSPMQSKIPVASLKKEPSQRLELVAENTCVGGGGGGDDDDDEALPTKRLSLYDNVASKSVSTSDDVPKAPLSEVLDSAEAERRFVNSAAVNKLLAEYETPKAEPIAGEPRSEQQVEGKKRPRLSRGWTVDDEELNEMIRMSKSRKAAGAQQDETVELRQAGAVRAAAAAAAAAPAATRYAQKPPIAPRERPAGGATRATGESVGAAPVVIAQKQVVTKDDLIQEPEDELMAVATAQVVDRRPAATCARASEPQTDRGLSRGGQKRTLLRRESTFSFDDNNSDSDSSFASAAASRQRFVTRFGRRAMATVGGGGAAAAANDEAKGAAATGSGLADNTSGGGGGGGSGGKQQRPAAATNVSRKRAAPGPVGGSLVERMARNFEQAAAAQQQRDNPSQRAPAAARAHPLQQRVEAGVDEEMSHGSDHASWYDAKSMELLDEQELAELLAEFEDDGAGVGVGGAAMDERTRPGSSLRPSVQVEPLTPSDVSQFDQFFSTVEDEQPFVSVAESTLDEDRAKRDRTDVYEDADKLGGGGGDDDDDTLNDGDEVDEESLHTDNGRADSDDDDDDDENANEGVR